MYTYTTPVMSYTIRKTNSSGQIIDLSSNTRVSFNAPHNTIYVAMRPNEEIHYFEVRITLDEANGSYQAEEYGPRRGTCPYYSTMVPTGSDTTFTLTVNNTYFTKGDGKYRISLYARSDNGAWDATYLFVCSNGEYFIPSNSTGLEVLTTEESPVH